MTPQRLVIDDPAGVLRWIAEARANGRASFDGIEVAHAFAVAAVAALARRDGPSPLPFASSASPTGAARFAHAIGLPEVIAGAAERQPTERERTVTLTRIRGRGPKEAIAQQIVELLLPTSTGTDAGYLFRYVLVELLRNVVQHSNDPLGGIVAAQVNDQGPYAAAPALQIVVVDNGIGIFEALHDMRPRLTTPVAALTAALEPHVSGTFEEGSTGTGENAGMGLFFISEMAKATDGKFFLASRGATYFLDRSESLDSQPVITNGSAPDYPGTLVVFETAISKVGEYDEIIAHIRRLAAERTPKRITQRWLRFESAPAGAYRVLVGVASEDTAAARQFALTVLEPRLLRRDPIELDFQNLRACTQSFLHSLLHESVRLAWARKVPMYVVNAAPAIRSQLELVESYSLGG